MLQLPGDPVPPRASRAGRAAMPFNREAIVPRTQGSPLRSQPWAGGRDPVGVAFSSRGYEVVGFPTRTCSGRAGNRPTTPAINRHCGAYEIVTVPAGAFGWHPRNSSTPTTVDHRSGVALNNENLHVDSSGSVWIPPDQRNKRSGAVSTDTSPVYTVLPQAPRCTSPVPARAW